MEKLKELAAALFFEGVSRLVVAIEARRGKVDYVFATEGDEVESVPYALATAQRDENGLWHAPEPSPGPVPPTVPVTAALQDAVMGYLNVRNPGWMLGAGSTGTVTLDLERGTAEVNMTRNRRPRGRHRKRRYRARRR